MNDNELIEYLRKKEANFLPEAPNGLWEDIESNLPQSAKPHRIVPIWLRYSGVAASIALLFGVGSLFVSSPNSEVAKRNFAKKESMEKTINKEEQQTLAEKIIAKAKPTFTQYSLPSTNQIKEEDTIISVEENPTTPPVERKSPSNTRRKKQSNDLWLAQDLNMPMHHSNNKVSFSLYAASIMASNTSAKNNFMVSTTLPSDETIEDSPYGEIIDLNEGVDMDTKKHYRQPVRTGIRVAIPITDALAIESGLTYTYLSSSTKSGSEDNYYLTAQKLHYVGIPLKLCYKLWSNKRIGIYVSGGGMVEKCVSGQAETTFVINGKDKSTEKQTVSEKPLQLSASLSAGIEANVTNGISIFVEPGVSYYIDNHSSIDNIYKDKPINFDLNVGIRISSPFRH